MAAYKTLPWSTEADVSLFDACERILKGKDFLHCFCVFVMLLRYAVETLHEKTNTFNNLFLPTNVYFSLFVSLCDRQSVYC